MADSTDGAERVEDWTERYRPKSERHLEGNEAQRKRIRQWLQQWGEGKPEKVGILLTGPPGVGKTSIALAIAADMGWDVIELNASDERNAAALRRAATSGATHFTFGLDGSFTTDETRHSLILIDEVDHLGGSFRATSEKRITSTIAARSEDEDNVNELRGDTGGKAELLRLLQISKQPVILTCNDPMRLWGRGRGWRTARDRFSRLAEIIQFRRASPTALRRIANRVIAAEDITADSSAVDRLVSANPGDIRALVRDLQAISSTSEHLDADAVVSQVSMGVRDLQIDLFPGLDQLYRIQSANEAAELGRILDKSPEELVAWVAWNNASIFRQRANQARGMQTLASADQALFVRYSNLAYRSSYWGGNLGALAANIASDEVPPDRISLSFPEFLRRGNEPWRRGSIVERLAETCGASQQAVREELWPPLRAVSSSAIGARPRDFSLSLALNLSAEDHLALHGLPASAAKSKEIAAAYEAAWIESNSGILEDLAELMDEPEITSDEEPVEHVENEEASAQDEDEQGEPDEGQTRLDLF